MSLGFIYFKGAKIIRLDFESMKRNKTDIEQVKELTLLVNAQSEKAFVLVNVRNYMPGRGFLEFATKSLSERAEKISKAAYVGLSKKNRKLYEFYDKFNSNIVKRKIFEDEEAALLWLTDYQVNDLDS